MNEKPLLIKIIHGLIITVVFLVPLLLTKQFVFLFTPEKTFLFYALVEITFFLWLYVIFRNKEYTAPKSPALIIGALFLCFYTLSAALSTSPEIAFFSTISRMSGLILIYHVAAFILVLSATVRDTKTWYLIFYTSLLSASIVAFLGYFGPFGLMVMKFATDSGSLIGNTTYEASYLLFNIFLAILLLLKAQEVRDKVIFGSVVLLIFFSPFFLDFYGVDTFLEYPIGILGQGRGATIALWSSLTLLSFLFLTQSKKTYIKKLSIALSVIIVVSSISVAILMVFPGTVPHSIIGKTEPGARIILWNTAITGIAEKPLLGWGHENYFVHFYQNIDSFFFMERLHGIGANNDKPHNAYLEIAFSGGLIGLFLYLAFFILLFWEIKRKDMPFKEKAILSALLFAYLLQNSFGFDVLVSYMMLAIVIGYIISTQNKIYPQNDSINTGVAPYFLVIPFIVTFWLFIYSPYNKQILLAQTLEDPRILNEEKTYSYLVNTVPDTHTSMLIFLATGMIDATTKDFNIPTEQKEDIVIKVQNIKETAAAYLGTNPTHYQLTLSLVRLIHIESIYEDNPQYKEELLLSAEKYENTLFVLSPGNPQNYWVTAQRQLLQDRVESAKETLTEVSLRYPNITATNEMYTSIEEYQRGKAGLPYFQY